MIMALLLIGVGCGDIAGSVFLKPTIFEAVGFIQVLNIGLIVIGGICLIFGIILIDKEAK